VLGGLVYSQFHLESLSQLPHYASWIAPSKLSALLAVAATLLLLVPLGLVAFVALARRQAKALTLAFFATNLLVLLPTRHPLVILVLAGSALLALLELEFTRFGQSAELDTLEGKLARAVVFVPPLVMLGRVFHLYEVRAPFWGGLFLLGAAGLWQLLPRSTKREQRDFGALLAGGIALFGWGLCWSDLVPYLHSASSGVLALGLPCAVLLVVASLRAAGMREPLLAGGTLLGLGSALGAGLLDLDSLSALFCVLAGVSVAVFGAAVRARVRTVAGSLVALFGLVSAVWLAVRVDDMLRWASLTVLGVLLIVGSAYVERHRARVARFWERLGPVPREE